MKRVNLMTHSTLFHPDDNNEGRWLQQSYLMSHIRLLTPEECDIMMTLS